MVSDSDDWELPLSDAPASDRARLLARPLRDITFLVVDLETTGASPNDGSGITEFGAVKVRGGVVLGEFKTFVNPDSPIPAFITVLTGITDAMVAPAPKIAEVLPNFLEFCGSAAETVLVAHNAGFDTGFLKAAAKNLDYPWPGYQILDTVKMARAIVPKEEVGNYKLSSLANLFQTEVRPTHRALDDAQTTVEVLHRLLERVGNRGIDTLGELFDLLNQITPAQREKKHLAANLPQAPGVYIFRDPVGQILYIGTATNLRNRVRSYFTAAETRFQMRQMVALADRVDHIVCQTPIEAAIRELRLIGEHKPRFNRRSRFPEKALWIRPTSERYPRLSIGSAASLTNADSAIGPFRGRSEAQYAIEALSEGSQIRQCNLKITKKSEFTPCALHDMGKCGAPCNGLLGESEYELSIANYLGLINHDCQALIEQYLLRIQTLSDQERFEEAGENRDRLLSLINGLARSQRIKAFTALPLLITAREIENTAGSIWEFVLIRHGRLVSSAKSTPGVALSATISSMKLASEQVLFKDSPLPASNHEEVERLLAYLEQGDYRIVEIEGVWALPINGAGKNRHRLQNQGQTWSAFSTL